VSQLQHRGAAHDSPQKKGRQQRDREHDGVDVNFAGPGQVREPDPLERIQAEVPQEHAYRRASNREDRRFGDELPREP
jgi:hypothetical protein